ncbi:two-component system sensor histidine kinase YesM [Paenibacillus anaericanus]|uniref:sensor histidine kinase n=1 Tax=Paenibacillus anaericanus TaxID=170367 RepID=UPI002780759A|nr:histidine kinase [Paenibacillus anaericanus]MDQ0089142.1 two-component system sensor histidine kinase YesM [Paenibacillus anaericanus]
MISSLIRDSQRKARSLRQTLVIHLMIGSLLPLILVGIVTYTSIHSILSGKIHSGISASLKQEAFNLENAIDNLDFASKQFALDGQIVAEVSDFLQEKQIYRKSQIMASINQKINLVNFTNPYIGLTAYIMPDAEDPVLFTNMSMKPDTLNLKLPEFIRYNGANYYGPHPTMYVVGDNLVFSEQRSVGVSGDQKLYIYLETNYSLFRKILNQESYGMKVTHLLVNQQGATTYVEDDNLPQSVIGAVGGNSHLPHEEHGGYHLFRYESPQGWQLIAAVKKSTFNSEIYTWFYKMILLSISTLLFAGFLGMFLWKQVYGPLRKVNLEIVRMAENRTTPVSYTNVVEFDFVLQNFQDMKNEVNELILAVSRNEKQKSQFEIEKLLSQINPHFLHNTLNSVQWLARLNGQKEIDKLVTLLVKVLHYNLGKQSLIVTIQDEIEAMRNYMELQRIRYDYEFEFHVEVSDEVMSVAVPRFLLQPLVENSIYHGVSEQSGKVDVTAIPFGLDHVLLRVKDNGIGIDPAKLEHMFSDEEEAKKRGLGIGLSYVNRMLRHYYGDQVQLDIVSEPGVGTTVSIIIPKKAKEDFHD